MVARDTPQICVTRCRPWSWSVEGETWRLIASTSGVPKGGWSPAARSSLRAARWPSSGRPLSPWDGRSRRPERPPAGSSTTPRPLPGRRPASRSGRRRSPRAGATAVPDPHPATAAAPRPACVAPTSVLGARAWTRLRQRGGRAPTGPRPPQPLRPSSTSLQSSTCKAVSQRTVGRGRRDLSEPQFTGLDDHEINVRLLEGGKQQIFQGRTLPVDAPRFNLKASIMERSREHFGTPLHQIPPLPSGPREKRLQEFEKLLREKK